MIPTLAVALSTQSSLACLPAMLEASKTLGVDAKKADIALPLAVALFRFTSTAMNLAVVIYIAWLFGIGLTPWTMAVGLAVARSEEHTSELQSLMRISYAVFCLKKKNIQITSRRS